MPTRPGASFGTAIAGLVLAAVAGWSLADAVERVAPAARVAALEGGARLEISGPARAGILAGRLALASEAPDAAAHAAATLRQALAWAPADSHGWSWLATAEALRHDWPAAARAWSMAVQTAPFDPVQLSSRLANGLRLWLALDAPGQAALRDQIRRHWHWGPGRLAELAAEQPAAMVLIRQTLAEEPAALVAFDRRLAALGHPD